MSSAANKMAASTIARWNAIPMSREDHSLKRSRPDEGDDVADGGGGDDDDDMSLVSRSPSPENMDVDAPESISKYDEYHRGVEREVITVDTRIKSTNKGFTMLSKLGWVEGQPLGLSADGRVDPVPFYVKSDLTGLGKTNQDFRMIETTVAQRRGLDSERQQKETEEQRKAREEHVARRTAVQSEISSTLRAFYCTLCDKQFKTVTQYDEHTNSYAHHHKARLRDLQANARIVPKEDLDKRKEKERKREEKELRKIAAANGIKMPRPAAASTSTVAAVEPAAAMDTSKKSGGWVSLAVSSPSSHAQPSGFKRAGWSTVSGPSPSATPPPPPPPPSAPPTPPAPTSSEGGWQKASSPPEPPASSSAPAFRAGGWASLDDLPTSTSTPPPLPPHSEESRSPRPMAEQHRSVSDVSMSAPVPAAQPIRSGWQQFKQPKPKRS